MMGDKSKLNTATARVKIVMDVPASGSWGPDCSLDQIFRQAERETINMVENILRKEGVRIQIVSSEVTAMSAVGKGS